MKERKEKRWENSEAKEAPLMSVSRAMINRSSYLINQINSIRYVYKIALIKINRTGPLSPQPVIKSGIILSSHVNALGTQIYTLLDPSNHKSD